MTQKTKTQLTAEVPTTFPSGQQIKIVEFRDWFIDQIDSFAAQQTAFVTALSADLTIIDAAPAANETNANFVYLDTNGANRKVTLAADKKVEGNLILVKNTGTAGDEITIHADLPTNPTLATLQDGQFALLQYDADTTTWVIVFLLSSSLSNIDHGGLSGLADDDHPQYQLRSEEGAANGYASLDASTLVPVAQIPTLDHGSKLSGLADDDHPQYHNDTRGDIRYYTKTLLDGGQLDNRYYTESEIDTQQGVQDTAIGLNTAKVSADGSIDTHSDVDVTTSTPVVGDLLRFDGSNWVPTKANLQRSIVQNTAVAFTSATFIDIPSLSTTIDLDLTGTIDGVLHYSAERSGATSSFTEFRIVINGTNGPIFADNLTSFHDTGVAAFFVSSLAAGTYTVSAQCQTTEPITIDSAVLIVSAIED